MKKIIKPTLKTLLVSLLVFGAYYGYVLQSRGTSEIHYIEPEQEFTSFRELVQQPELKGKIIYADFWRTTCHPCLEEFKATPKLKQHFKQYGDQVAFLYLGADISVPGEEFRWKRMIEKKNLTGYHYFLRDKYFDAIWNTAVNDPAIPPQFPQYLIINARGEVINNNAPRPTDKRLYKVLEDALTNSKRITADFN